MSHVDPDLLDLLQDFFATEVTPEVVDAAERAGALPADLWARAEAVEIPWIGIAEEHGGVGGSLADAVAMVQEAARRAAPLPLVEHHLAAWLLGLAGLERIDGPLTVAGLREEVTVTDGTVGPIVEVAWAADARAVVALAREDDRAVVVVLDRDSYDVEPGTDLAGIPVPTVVPGAGATVRVVPLPVPAEQVRRRAELLRCAQLAGLTDAIFELTRAYVAERHQFGKPVGSFQAVQVHTVTLAQCASMSLLSVDRSVLALEAGSGEFEVAATAVVTAQNAVQAAAAAHQAHGAIGMTREYPLQFLTRRVHAWRQRWTAQPAAERVVGDWAFAATALSQLVSRHHDEGTPA